MLCFKEGMCPRSFRTLPLSFSSVPWCLQEARRGHRRALATQPALDVLWGEDAAPGSCTGDTEAGGGEGPSRVTPRIRRVPASQPPTPELLPSSSQGHSLRSPGRAPGSPSHCRAEGCSIHHGSIFPSVRPSHLGEVRCQAILTPPMVGPGLSAPSLCHISKALRAMVSAPHKAGTCSLLGLTGAYLHTCSSEGPLLAGHLIHCGAALPVRGSSLL